MKHSLHREPGEARAEVVHVGLRQVALLRLLPLAELLQVVRPHRDAEGVEQARLVNASGAVDADLGPRGASAWVGGVVWCVRA